MRTAHASRRWRLESSATTTSSLRVGTKVVEVELKEKGTPLHAACVVGDTVGDPFKDTSSVAMNPVIKFTTLFGLLAVELAANLDPLSAKCAAAICFFISLFFVRQSFYGMRIEKEEAAPQGKSESDTELQSATAS